VSTSKRFIITITADSDSRGLYQEDLLRKLSHNRYNLNNVRTHVGEATKIESLVLDLTYELQEQARNLADGAADTAVEDHDNNRHF